jgi:hypothetical protein
MMMLRTSLDMSHAICHIVTGEHRERERERERESERARESEHNRKRNL